MAFLGGRPRVRSLRTSDIAMGRRLSFHLARYPGGLPPRKRRHLIAGPFYREGGITPSSSLRSRQRLSALQPAIRSSSPCWLDASFCKPASAMSEPGPRFQSPILAYVILCRRAKFLRLRRQASQLRLLRFMGITLRDAHRTSGGPALEKPRTRRSADYMYLQDRHQCSPQFDNNLQ